MLRPVGRREACAELVIRELPRNRIFGCGTLRKEVSDVIVLVQVLRALGVSLSSLQLRPWRCCGAVGGLEAFAELVIRELLRNCPQAGGVCGAGDPGAARGCR